LQGVTVIKKHWKKFLSSLLSVIIVLSLILPNIAFAASSHSTDWIETQPVNQPLQLSEPEYTDDDSNLTDNSNQTPYILFEDTSKRSKYSKEYVMSDRSQLLVVYPDAVHYKENNEWKNIDNTIKVSSDDDYSGFTNTSSSWDVYLPFSFTPNNSDITIKKDNKILRFGANIFLEQFPDAEVELPVVVPENELDNNETSNESISSVPTVSETPATSDNSADTNITEDPSATTPSLETTNENPITTSPASSETSISDDLNENLQDSENLPNETASSSLIKEPIAEITKLSGKTTSYVYDGLNQLIRENNESAGKTWTYSYDAGGNFVEKKEYTYTTGTLGEAPDTIFYGYTDASWGDLLTSYDGNTVSSNAIGNMLSDGTWTYTWQHGRQLASMTNGTTTAAFTYDGDRLRTSKTVGTTTWQYICISTTAPTWCR